MPLISCRGCGKSVKRSGLYPHLRQSGNLLCQAYLHELTFGGPTTVLPNTLRTDHQLPQSTSGTATLSPPSTPPNEPSNLSDNVEIDTAGDFFGNYDDYTPQELGLGANQNLQLDQDVEMSDNDGFSPDVQDPEDYEDALLESLLAEEENGLEPPRVNVDMEDPLGSEDETPVDTGPAVNTAVNMTKPSLRLHGGAEESLQSRPFVVKFQKGHAGAIYNQEAQNENGRYEEAIGDPENPYAPFQSELEWRIARWAKLRGPSSTAFTELMSIDGVSKMSNNLRHLRSLPENTGC